MSSGRILIVEDEKPLREIYHMILTHAGYTVETSVNGKEALAAVAKQQPDIVLLDIFMPIMDGKEFMHQLKRQDYPDMTIVVCSNTSDGSMRDEMLKLGVDKIVLKSELMPSDLVALVEPYANEKRE